MQLDLSITVHGTPRSLRQAATAKPEGPAPTITGPATQTHRGQDLSIFLMNKGS